MASSDDSTLVKIAIFGIAMSLVVSAMCTMFLAGTSDYDYDAIAGYRSDLVKFSGESMLNETPWVLSHVYTPFQPSQVAEEDTPNHRDEAGWLFGEDVTTYPYLHKSADIKLAVGQKSNQELSIGDPYEYTYRGGYKAWAGGNNLGIDLRPIAQFFVNLATGGGVAPGLNAPNDLGDDYGRIYETAIGNNWNYTGYRYVFDPTLPFADESSSKDGQLSIVWYDYDQNTGISGGLDIYGAGHAYGESPAETRLASIGADEIIRGYQSSGGYSAIYPFNFGGVHLKLHILFDPQVMDNYNMLREAWDAGAWSMAISSPSAGNFFDVENTSTFTNTAGNMIDTFVQIYTFQVPEFENDPWANVILWLMCGLPMTFGMLLITSRLVGGVFKIF